MANSFGWTSTLVLEEHDPAFRAFSLGQTITNEIALLDTVSLGTIFLTSPESAEFALGPTNIIATGGLPINDAGQITRVTTSGNLIHRSEIAELRCNRMIFANELGVGPMSVVSYTSMKFTGQRCGMENKTENFFMAKEESGYIWTNTGVVAPMYGVLPPSASDGTSAVFIRTGAALSIVPSGARIMMPESGVFSEIGVPLLLASSGAICKLVSDGNNRWYIPYKFGSVT